MFFSLDSFIYQFYIRDYQFGDFSEIIPKLPIKSLIVDNNHVGFLVGFTRNEP